MIQSTFKKTSLISVIMPCYNAEKYIEDSVQSVLGQTFPSIELIVVDDGSTDASLDKLKKIQAADSRIRIVRQKNKGPGPARNKGLSEACGEYIAFLDSDDYWDKDCLEELQKALLNNFPSGSGLAYCGWQNIGLSEKRSRPFIPPDYSAFDLPELFLGGCRWPIHAVLISRNYIEEVGGFNEQWTSCMDYDLWLRMTPFIKIVLVPKVLAYYRHHGSGQITSKRAVIAENHWMIQRQFLKAHPEIRQRLGNGRIKELVGGELLKRGFVCYWERDLDAAHTIFRQSLKQGYYKMKDLKYLILTLFPLPVYKRIIQMLDGK